MEKTTKFFDESAYRRCVTPSEISSEETKKERRRRVEGVEGGGREVVDASSLDQNP